MFLKINVDAMKIWVYLSEKIDPHRRVIDKHANYVNLEL